MAAAVVGSSVGVGGEKDRSVVSHAGGAVPIQLPEANLAFAREHSGRLVRPPSQDTPNTPRRFSIGCGGSAYVLETTRRPDPVPTLEGDVVGVVAYRTAIAEVPATKREGLGQRPSGEVAADAPEVADLLGK